ncbi:MAG: hypothetical protein WDN69_23245 [Aliidongia sp.]
MLLPRPARPSPYEPTSCTFFNIKGFVDTARSLGLLVVEHRSPHEPAAARPGLGRSAADRSQRSSCVAATAAWTTRRVMGYWDGRSDAPEITRLDDPGR